MTILPTSQPMAARINEDFLKAEVEKLNMTDIKFLHEGNFLSFARCMVEFCASFHAAAVETGSWRLDFLGD